MEPSKNSQLGNWQCHMTTLNPADWVSHAELGSVMVLASSARTQVKKWPGRGPGLATDDVLAEIYLPYQ